MGNKRTVNTDLPPRMLSRCRGGVNYYTYATPGTSRKEIPLGTNKAAALRMYKVISSTSDSLMPVPANWHLNLHQRLLNNAKHRGIEVSITADDISSRLYASDMRCEVSGIKFDMRQIEGKRFRPWIPSIDRIDSSGSYSSDNFRIVCAAVNFALNQFGDEVLFKMARSIASKGLG